MEVLQVEGSLSTKWFPDRLAGFFAIMGLLLVSLPGFNVRTWQDAGSDFKTLYASANCFMMGVRAYDFRTIELVFLANHVVLPVSWYAHAPTYPPFTLALLAPVASLPMVTAVYLWMVVSAAALLFAVWAMTDVAQRTFGLGPAWRLLLVALVAASPLVSFALQIGNVSMVASALCLLALVGRHVCGLSWQAAALTISLLLKPHVALILLLGMLISRDQQDRRLAVRTMVFFAISLVCLGTWISVHLPMGLQLRDYTKMVRSEMATGCLNPHNHELLPPAAEITSLESLLGFFLRTPWMRAANGALLLLMAGALAYVSRFWNNITSERRLEILGAWSTLGLLATYHRTHDAIILFLLLPWGLTRLHRRWNDAVAWGVLMLQIVMSLGSFPPTFEWIRTLGFSWLSDFFVYRQSAIGTVLLMLLLLADLLRQTRSELRRGGPMGQLAAQDFLSGHSMAPLQCKAPLSVPDASRRGRSCR